MLVAEDIAPIKVDVGLYRVHYKAGYAKPVCIFKKHPNEDQRYVQFTTGLCQSLSSLAANSEFLFLVKIE
jgi:hypothetical protein